MNGEDDNNVVNLDEFRKQKHALVIHVGKYYANLEMGVYLHVVGITGPMHTKNAETHFVVEDHFGNLVTFRHDDPPPGFRCVFFRRICCCSDGTRSTRSILIL